MQLSYTKLKTFSECPLKYRLAYIERLPRPPIKALAFQRRIHTALGQYHLFAKWDGTVHLDELLSAYDQAARGDERPEIRDTAEYRDGIEILQAYHEREQHRGRVPAFVERTFKVDFGPYVLTGKVDRLDFTDSGGYSLIDYKLDRKLPEGNSADENRQLSFYHLLVYEGLGVAPEDVQLYYLRHGVEHVSVRSRAQMAETVGWIDVQAAGIREERKWRPCEGDACHTCPFWSHCPAKTGAERPLTPVWQQGSLVLASTSAGVASVRPSVTSGPSEASLQMSLCLESEPAP